LTSWFCFWFFSHCLAHFVVGSVLGVRFRFYFVGKSSLLKLNLPVVSSFPKYVPILGIKIEDARFRQVAARKRALMYASGVLASMIFPIMTVLHALAYFSASITAFFTALTTLNILLTLLLSSKAGDFWKANKTLKQMS